MARLRDAPIAIHRTGAWPFTKRVWEQINDDNLLVWAAAMAFSWLFAIFPFMIFLLSLVPYLPPQIREDARRELDTVVEQWLPEEAAETMQGTIEDVLTQPRGGWLSISFLITLWVASGGMAMTMEALNKCYDVEVTRVFYVERPIAIGLTIAVAILVLAILFLLPVGTIVTLYLMEQAWAEGREVSMALVWLWNIARWTLAVLFMLLVLALVYYFGATRVRHNFRIFSPGALLSVLLWVVLAVGFRIYVDSYGRYDQMYGALGGVVVLLMLFYLYSLIILVGAEMNAEIDLIVRGEPEGASDPEAAPAVGEESETAGQVLGEEDSG
jgi:membrane protein